MVNNQEVNAAIEQSEQRQAQFSPIYQQLGGPNFYPQAYLDADQIYAVMGYIRDLRVDSVGAGINLLVREEGQRKRDEAAAAHQAAMLAHQSAMLQEQRESNRLQQVEGQLTRAAINDPEWRKKR